MSDIKDEDKKIGYIKVNVTVNTDDKFSKLRKLYHRARNLYLELPEWKKFEGEKIMKEIDELYHDLLRYKMENDQ